MVWAPYGKTEKMLKYYNFLPKSLFFRTVSVPMIPYFTSPHGIVVALEVVAVGVAGRTVHLYLYLYAVLIVFTPFVAQSCAYTVHGVHAQPTAVVVVGVIAVIAHRTEASVADVGTAVSAYVVAGEGFLYEGVCAPVVVYAIVEQGSYAGNGIVGASPQGVVYVSAYDECGAWRQLGGVCHVNVLRESCSASMSAAPTAEYRCAHVDR